MRLTPPAPVTTIAESAPESVPPPAVPPRAPHAHASEGDAPAILFSFQDVPLLTALGLYRSEA